MFMPFRWFAHDAVDQVLVRLLVGSFGIDTGRAVQTDFLNRYPVRKQEHVVNQPREPVRDSLLSRRDWSRKLFSLRFPSRAWSCASVLHGRFDAS